VGYGARQVPSNIKIPNGAPSPHGVEISRHATLRIAENCSKSTHPAA